MSRLHILNEFYFGIFGVLKESLKQIEFLKKQELNMNFHTFFP